MDKTYCVFIRDWWTRDKYGNKIPYLGAPKETLFEGLSYGEALDECKKYNEENDPGWTSRKAEFTEE